MPTILALRPIPREGGLRVSRWLTWCMNVVIVLALAAQGAHVHAAESPSHPCAVCAVSGAPAVAADPEPAAGAPEPAPDPVVEQAPVAPVSRAVAVPASRGPPRIAS
jgi:hypothetical protein